MPGLSLCSPEVFPLSKFSPVVRIMLLVCNALSMQYNFDAALGGTFTACVCVCVCICICICNHSRHGFFLPCLLAVT